MIPYSDHSRHYHQLTYNQHHHHHHHHNLQHHHRSKMALSDRRIRMSQPTLNSSFFSINFIGGMKENRKLSYSSLRTSRDNSIHSQIQHDHLSSPNVHAFDTSIQENNDPQIINAEYRHDVLSQSDMCRIVRPSNYAGKRERLSQPTLITGDYYPPRMQHQRLSQPCLLSTWNEKPINLHSPIKQKHFNSAMSKISQRDRMSQLDFGNTAKFKYMRELSVTSKKFNRDRFSIPELETQNDLRLIAGTPKQRYSLDSQLNPEGNRMRKLLPIASSPISENQTGNATKDSNNREIMPLIAGEKLENIIVATATPIVQPSDRHLFAPVLITPSTLLLPVRERMSVPEIRNASLRRLLNSPMKQRHSITGNLRQSSIHKENEKEKITSEVSMDINKKILTTEDIIATNPPEIEITLKPKHFQRHYSYTYDNKDDANEVIGKLGVVLPKKKYLESNFDENEQVITTVIETEIPMILGNTKYSKKTHVYASETPKWMKKCLECDNSEKKKSHDSKMLKINQMNLAKQLTKEENPINNKIYSHNPLLFNPSELAQNIICMPISRNDECVTKNTCVRVKSTGNIGIDEYKVTIDSDWCKTDTCNLGRKNIDDIDSEDSTSI